MISFFRNGLLAFIALVLVTAAIIYLGYRKSQLSADLYPVSDGHLKWVPVIEPPEPRGKTWLKVKSELGTIDYEFFLDPQTPFPYTHYSFHFVDFENPYALVDLRRFDRISFKISCDPKNVMLAALFSFDEKVTRLDDATTRRVSSAAFSCDSQWASVTIPFDNFTTQQWWLGKFGYAFSENGYDLQKIMGIAVINSLQSPLNALSHIRLTEVRLEGEQPRYFYLAVIFSGLLWVAFLVVMVRYYIRVLTRDLMNRVKHDQPLLAYKKLTIEPQKDKDKSALLRYMATEYADSELSLEQASTSLGINRTKINEILKEELGLTFTAYLNKLRLTEAARLLSEKNATTVSEIAYSVGYNNVSYFNKLFKNEYGCTPKTFKNIYLEKSNKD